jgi:hypothetical protein
MPSAMFSPPPILHLFAVFEGTVKRPVTYVLTSLGASTGLGICDNALGSFNVGNAEVRESEMNFMPSVPDDRGPDLTSSLGVLVF